MGRNVISAINDLVIYPRQDITIFIFPGAILSIVKKPFSSVTVQRLFSGMATRANSTGDFVSELSTFPDKERWEKTGEAAFKRIIINIRCFFIKQMPG